MSRRARAGSAAPELLPALLAGLPAGLLVALLAPVAAAPGASAGSCSGVTVVVEPRGVDGWRGGGRTGCARAGGTGLDVLRAAGFDVRLGTGAYAGGFVCALEGAPTSGCAAVDSDTYWSYWYRAPGDQDWTYSPLGAAAHASVSGSTEAWVWQDGGSIDRPSAVPAAESPAAPTRRASGRTPEPAPVVPGRDAEQEGARGDGSAGREGVGATSPTAGSGAGRSTGGAAGARAGAVTAPGASRSAAGAGVPAGASAPVPALGASAAAAAGARAAASTEDAPASPARWPVWTGVAAALAALVLGGDAVRRARQARP